MPIGRRLRNVVHYYDGCLPEVPLLLVRLYLVFVLSYYPPPLNELIPTPTEPSEVHVTVDGETDLCSRGEDINFQLLGFSVFGQVR